MFVDLQNIDLTGADSNFSRQDMPYVVFKAGQVIEFHEPVFADTIVVYKVSGSGLEELQSVSDYTIPRDPNVYAEYVDYNAISDAKVKASASGNMFDRNLVKAIVMSDNFTGEYRISVNAQALYRRYSDFTEIGTGPEYSRSFGASIIERLNYLETAVNPLSRITSTDLGNVSPLDEDLTGVAESNYIQGETHNVNVPNNVFVIRPLYGDFYDDNDLKIDFTGIEQCVINDTFIGRTIVVNDVEIELNGTNIYEYVGKVQDVKVPTRTLVRGTDYIVRGIERAKTRIALTTTGVYSTIILSKKFRGECVISYHAFGGDVSIRDIYTIKDMLMTVLMNLTGNTFMTVEQFNVLPKVVNIIDRIEKLEDILHVHRPVAIPFEYTENVRWVDVATLYPAGYTEEGTIPERYTETFRLVNESQDYDATFDLSYDLGTQSLEVTNTRITSCKFAIEGASYFDNRRCPVFRVVYDKSDTSKGLVLQMSVISDTLVSELWQIHLCHYNEALWSIIDKDGAYRIDASNITTLPSGTVWGFNITNMVSTSVGVISDPYTVFAGNISMNFLDSVSYREGAVYNNVADNTDYEDEPGQVELDGFIIDAIGNKNILKPGYIRGFVFTIFDRYEGKYICKSSNTGNVVGDSVFGEVVYFDLDMCQVSASLKVVEDQVKLVIKSHTGTNSLESNRFDLRQIDVLFNGKDI